MSSITNAMTVDVEDYFQVSAFEKYIPRESWDDLDLRVEANVDAILEIFSEHDVKATFFLLGWVAEKCPGMIHKITEQGHELASHGYSHVRVHDQQRDEFREDIVKTKQILEDISGKSIAGYRAASFSVNKEEHWVHEELMQAGFKYSSSVYPIRHDLYGIPDGKRYPYKPFDGDLIEVPVTTLEFFGLRIPCGGGGYFRLFPYQLSSWFIRKINSSEKSPCIFYFHPWELDIDQPRLEKLDWKTNFRHYNGIEQMNDRLSRLSKEFVWDRMDNVFLGA